jgi:hypothetical protein
MRFAAMPILAKAGMNTALAVETTIQSIKAAPL